MGCGSCALKGGGCATGGKSCGCNKKSVYNWLADLPEPAYRSIIPVEVSFKKGARKEFFQCKTSFDTLTGDFVVVESDKGYDVGRISMSGELVNLQMKKHKEKRKLPDLPKVIRPAKEEDIAKLQELREREKQSLIDARIIARNLGLDMKIGDVEYQGNGKKITIFYTAEGRVDFRQLIREYATKFRVRIEMRQIGMRQESARIGGLGVCGRELCCSSWLTEFKSVTTQAARYQNLSINQTKLSGQCGRLKCCLNFELDNYMEAWKDIPKKVDRIETEEGVAFLQKTDILRKIMVYKYPDRSQYYKLTTEKVKEIQALNKAGKKPENLNSMAIREAETFLEKEVELVGQIELEDLKTSKRRKNWRKKRNNNKKGGKGNNNQKQQGGKQQANKQKQNQKNKPQQKQQGGGKSQNNQKNSGAKNNTQGKSAANKKRRRPKNRNNNKKDGDKGNG